MIKMSLIVTVCFSNWNVDSGSSASAKAYYNHAMGILFSHLSACCGSFQ